ncbi:hypothetical protein [Halorhabdus amylolytica]|uniref:hypothetical protein n=1 Tax=Halorhabdus amylolytica TaxID=2559573 RepID=UPI0010AAB5A0|nr:hypothetical protein [Halorhabdus amylolytica]
MSSSGGDWSDQNTNVPQTSAFISKARTYGSITSFLGAMVGSIYIALTYLLNNPIRALGVGFGYIVSQVTSAIGDLLAALPAGIAEVVDSGFQASADAVGNEGIAGAIIAIALVWIAWYLFQLGQNVTDSDAPFVGDIIPFWGGGEDE